MPQLGTICTREKVLEIFQIISVLTSTSLFGIWKYTNVCDKEQLSLNILSSVLCQVKACAMIWRQAAQCQGKSRYLLKSWAAYTTYLKECKKNTVASEQSLTDRKTIPFRTANGNGSQIICFMTRLKEKCLYP